MMIVKTVMRKLIGVFKSIEKWADEVPLPSQNTRANSTNITLVATKHQAEQVQSIWDYLAIKENTQAAHAVSTIGFEEWIEMSEIRRRIHELFGMDYKNERSLYPYIKAMVDCGLFESSDIGGKRKWRKKALLLKVKHTEESKKVTEEKIAENAHKTTN